MAFTCSLSLVFASQVPGNLPFHNITIGQANPKGAPIDLGDLSVGIVSFAYGAELDSYNFTDLHQASVGLGGYSEYIISTDLPQLLSLAHESVHAGDLSRVVLCDIVAEARK